jgi:hypothetical protein
MTPTKPSRADIEAAIADSGNWLQMLDDGWLCWCCKLYDPDGNWDGTETCALTAERAMAQAWVARWAPIRPILPGLVPLTVPDGWRFKLTPPMTDDELGLDLGEVDAARAELIEELRLEELRRH